MDEKVIKKWRSKLGDLLERARGSAQAINFEERLQLADELQAFMIGNPPSLPDQPETAEFEEMDKIAHAVHQGLLQAAINDRLAIIVGQTAEFARLAKKIKSQTVANEKEAKAIRFEKAQKVLASVSDTVVAIKDLAQQVEGQTGTEKEIAALSKKLTHALETLQDLRATIEASE